MRWLPREAPQPDPQAPEAKPPKGRHTFLAYRHPRTPVHRSQVRLRTIGGNPLHTRVRCHWGPALGEGEEAGADEGDGDGGGDGDGAWKAGWPGPGLGQK